MFNADRPILKSEQDRLGRTIFAKYLARSILEHKNPESLAIGLYGGWGSGKTSIINLVVEELRYAASNMLEEEQPIILNFSAWSYSGQDQLVYSFFRRLSSELRRFPYLSHAGRIIHLLELYVSFFTHKPVPKSLRPKRSWMNKLFNRREIEEQSYAWESGRDLTSVKAELNELLAQQKHKIIIMIDNVSRLEDKEVVQIFQIMKSMGDYANTVYLLSCDKEQMIRAINNMQGSGGAEYLEKIVQLPFEVPAISKQDLENILLDRLKMIVEIVPKEFWNSDYWADIYYSMLKHFFDNCRDITRYINTLNFSYARIKDVVNPVDFFALTAIEVFEPHVYFGVRDNKDLFTDLLSNVYQTDEEKIKKDKLRVDEILQRTEHLPREIVKQLLIRLFPRLRDLYDIPIHFYHSETAARKNRRICSPDMFDVYFRLSMPTGYIPESEMEAILAHATNEQSFSQTLTRLIHDEKIIKFLDLLDGVEITHIPTQHISHVVNALMDNADLFPEGETSLLNFDTPMRVHRILHQLLMRFDTTQERFAILHEAIHKATKSLFIIVHELITQNKEHSEIEEAYLPLDHRTLLSNQLDELKKLAVQKIQSWAKNGRLIEHPKLIAILDAWKMWGREEDCQRFVLEAVGTDRGIVAFLGVALKEPVNEAMKKLEKNPTWEKYLKNIEDFIPVKKLEPRAKTLFEDLYFEKLREQEQLAILIFLDLIKADTLKTIPKTTA